MRTIYVKEYVRADGTVVRAHTRRIEEVSELIFAQEKQGDLGEFIKEILMSVYGTMNRLSKRTTQKISNKEYSSIVKYMQQLQYFEKLGQSYIATKELAMDTTQFEKEMLALANEIKSDSMAEMSVPKTKATKPVKKQQEQPHPGSVTDNAYIEKSIEEVIIDLEDYIEKAIKEEKINRNAFVRKIIKDAKIDTNGYLKNFIEKAEKECKAYGENIDEEDIIDGKDYSNYIDIIYYVSNNDRLCSMFHSAKALRDSLMNLDSARKDENAVIYDSVDKLGNQELARLLKDKGVLADESGVYYNENSDLAKKILNLNYFKYLIKSNLEYLKSGKTIKLSSGEFTSKIDVDLYLAIQKFALYDMKIVEGAVVCYLVDRYDFDEIRAGNSIEVNMNNAGYLLQHRGEITPYFIIVNLVIPLEQLELEE